MSIDKFLYDRHVMLTYNIYRNIIYDMDEADKIVMNFNWTIQQKSHRKCPVKITNPNNEN